MAITLALRGSIVRNDIRALCDRLHETLRRGGRGPVIIDVGGLTQLDAAAIDALARLQLVARRLGRQVLLRDAGEDLVDLLQLVGLVDLFPSIERSREPVGQVEEREQMGGVQEERDPGDPVT